MLWESLCFWLNSILTTLITSFFYSAASFTALDRNYLTPFFTSQGGEDDDEGKIISKHFKSKAVWYE